MRLKLALAFGICAALLAGAGAFSLAGLREPAGASDAEIVFEVNPGEPLASVARRLDALGLLPRRVLFGPRVLVAWARYTGVDRDVKTGEYMLSAALSPNEILEKLVSGRVKTYAVTVPEGLRLDEVAARLEQANVSAADAFLAAARDRDLARRIGVEAETLEGYLYPETYRFQRGTPPAEIVERMHAELLGHLTDEDRAAIASSGMSLHEVVTLASIVEKETAVDEERALVAAVYRNRLRLRMRLQSDPTVIYGILQTRGKFDGDIRRRDLLEDNVYNTYTRSGLPPGPIASATIESIRAVLAPADVSYLFFVSRNDGTHVFSKTLSQHTRAVNQYQRQGRGS